MIRQRYKWFLIEDRGEFNNGFSVNGGGKGNTNCTRMMFEVRNGSVSLGAKQGLCVPMGLFFVLVLRISTVSCRDRCWGIGLHHQCSARKSGWSAWATPRLFVEHGSNPNPIHLQFEEKTQTIQSVQHLRWWSLLLERSCSHWFFSKVLAMGVFLFSCLSSLFMISRWYTCPRQLSKSIAHTLRVHRQAFYQFFS